jgi:dienelactone hydrolase
VTVQASGNSTIHDEGFRLANGLAGTPLTIETANPTNYHQAISEPDRMPRLSMFGRLFLPEGDGPFPVVIVVPGSLGLASSHLEKVEILTNAGIAACPIDPFHARSVLSTVANQTQYSFAASAWDVLATSLALAAVRQVDSSRIGAQGHSRGGSAVLTAASTQLGQASDAPDLCAVYAAYPWCGHQFLNPIVGNTRVRAVIGDLDDWCLPQQVQAHIHAMRLVGGDASSKVFGGAHHSFDRRTPREKIDEAAVAPGAPTVYLSDDGAMIHPLTGAPDPALCDRELMVYALKAGYGRKGAHIGGGGESAQAFDDDMTRFWRSAMSA